MAVNSRERHENHMDISSPETSGDAKREEENYDSQDPYGDDFEKKLDGCSENSDKSTSENTTDAQDDLEKRKIETIKSDRDYKMNSPKTIDNIKKQYKGGMDWFDSVLDSAVGGEDGWKVKLQGEGKELYLTSDSNSQASGNFLSHDEPGNTATERKENLQLPPGNDAESVKQVISQKASIVMESKVAPQESWANEAGYSPKEGITQTFTPTLDKQGAIHAGVYKVKEEK